MSALTTIDFHTHGGVPGGTPDGALRVCSTPAAEFDRVLPAGCFKTLELHPWSATGFPDDFAELAGRSDCLGVGEAGLDRTRGKLPLSGQMTLFARVAAVAEAAGKPLTVHCVGCHGELLGLFKQKPWRVPTIFHYFTGKVALARQFLRLKNWYLSLAPITLRNHALMDFLRGEPSLLDRIVLETDDPRGDIQTHWRNAAQALALSVPVLAERMHENFRRIYPEAL